MGTVTATKTITLNEFEAIKGSLRVDDTPESIIVGNHFYEMDMKSYSLPRSGSGTPVSASAYINDTMGDVYIPNATDVKVYNVNPNLPVVDLLGGYTKALWNYGTAITDDHWEESDLQLLLQEAKNSQDDNTANKLGTFAHAKVMENLRAFSSGMQIKSAEYFVQNDAKYTPWAIWSLQMINEDGSHSYSEAIYKAEYVLEYDRDTSDTTVKKEVLDNIVKTIQQMTYGGGPYSERDLARYVFDYGDATQKKMTLDAITQISYGYADIHGLNEFVFSHGDANQNYQRLQLFLKWRDHDYESESKAVLRHLKKISNPQTAVEVAQKYLDSTWFGDDAVEEFIQRKSAN